ncbi:MAG: dTDP-4-dehydrorhamnose 3,5-epimerase family protein [Thermoguttaceae bacterium]
MIIRQLILHRDSRGWLAELFRFDELPPGFQPLMAYASQTLPGAARGPHEHRYQTDLFACFGPGELRLVAWDARSDSPTVGNRTSLVMGSSSPLIVLIPPGVVHGYRNEGNEPALVFNAPDRLFAGAGRREPIDEIRHEDNPLNPFLFDPV